MITVSTPSIEKVSETSVRVTYSNQDGATNWKFVITNDSLTIETLATIQTIFTFVDLPSGNWKAKVIAFVGNADDLPQIQQQGVSELFGQSKNPGTSRLLFWDGNKASFQTNNLAISFYGTNSLYERRLKVKLEAMNNNKPFKRKALLSLRELVAFSFSKKVFADGIWYLVDELRVVLKQEQQWYETELLLRRI